MKNRKGTLITLLIGVFLGGVVFFLVELMVSTKKKNIPFVSMTSVFQESKIKNKYAAELKTIETNSNSKLVSFEAEIRKLKAKGESMEKIEALEKELLALRDKLSEEYQKKSESFEAIIWQNINKSVAEYGKSKGYDYILGANGDGSIMYASEANDITNEIIEFINK